MINVNITNIVAESLAICAVTTCGVEDEKPPPAMRTIDEIYEEYGFTDKPSYAPYKDEQTAEYERDKRAMKEEIQRLESEIKELKSENKALKEGGNNVMRGDKRNHPDGDGVSSGGNSGNIHSKAVSEDETFEATFYTAFCPTGCTGVTASGVDVSNTIYHEGKRIVAVDPNVIPLGSHVRVTLEDGSSFEATAQDTGGDIKGNRIDILVASRDEAYRLGRQSAKVDILN